jgi:pilus assembly protein FimV
MVAGLDERSRRMMETAEQRAAGAPGSLSQSETGSWQLDGAIEEASADTANTSRLAALKSAGLDFDLGDAQAPAASTNGAGGPVDLDIGTATVPDAGFVATQRLGSEDLALPDLDPVTMSEVGTKLDLARAYMDMGDPEGARNILEEVLSEGSVAQKQEAERLIASLPG